MTTVPPLTPELEAAIRAQLEAIAGTPLARTGWPKLLAAVVAELDRCRDMLRSLEWEDNGSDDRYCPSCYGWQSSGHREGCALAALLGR